MKIACTILLLLGSTVLFAQKQERLTVHFNFDKYDILPAEATRLNNLVSTFALKTKGSTIEVSGHCDNKGTAQYNDTLSLKRAQAVKKYLVDHGVESSIIIKTEGYGFNIPAGNDASPAENRRVELVINTPEIKVAEKIIEQPVEKVIEKTITKKIEDTATKAGTKITLQNLNFVGGNHILLPESVAILNELLTVMKNNPKLVIAIEGHVCCIPDKGDGVDFATGKANLSEMRAKTVYVFLLQNGINADRISYRGFGHLYPINPYPERSDEERSMNRRVEIRIVSK
jgi:outer membrane protein OmpA-like peptidoglycan-associated protein